MVAAAFRLAGPTDRVVAATGALLWLGAVWLTLAIGWHRLGPGVGALAALFLACSIGGLRGVLDCMGAPLLMLWVLLSLWLLVDLVGRDPAKRPTTNSIPEAWQIGLLGAATGLATLTHHLMVGWALLVGGYIVFSRKPRGRCLLAYAAGWSCIVGPWWLRQSAVAGELFAGLYGYELLTGTARYPVATVWGSIDLPSPLGFIIAEPMMVLRKLIHQLANSRYVLVQSIDPLAGFLSLCLLFDRTAGRPLRLVAGLVISGLAVTLLLGGLFRPEISVIQAWVPALSLLAAAQLLHWVQHLGEKRGPSADEASVAPQPSRRRREFRFWIHRLPVSRRVAAAGIFAAVIAWNLFPLFYQLRARTSLRQGVANQSYASLTNSLFVTGLVMTDEPAWVAWHTRRTTIDLCHEERDLDRIEQRFGPLAAMYFTPAIVPLQREYNIEWWQWAGLRHGIYRNLQPATTGSVPGVLRIRPTTGDDPPPTTNASHALAQARADVQRLPHSANAHTELGFALMHLDYWRDAHASFEKALALAPTSVPAWLGARELEARISTTPDLFRAVDRVRPLRPAAEAERSLVELTARMVEGQFARGPAAAWWLIQAALLRAKLQQWEVVDKYLARLEPVCPNWLPSELLLANLYLQEKMIDPAGVLLERLARKQPRNALVHEALGQVYWNRGDHASALKEFQAAQRFQPTWSAPYIKGGYAALALGLTTEAERQFRDGLTHAPHSLALGLGLAEALQAQGKTTASDELRQRLQAEHPHAFAPAETPASP